MRRPTRLILTALASRPMHGYGILTAVKDLSAGSVELAVGTLYGALDRLESQGVIVQDREEIENGRLRRYYRLTDHGHEILATEVAVLEADARAARAVLAFRSAPGTVGGST
jgi:PadR family transcriptional regulator PadR